MNVSTKIVKIGNLSVRWADKGIVPPGIVTSLYLIVTGIETGKKISITFPLGEHGTCGLTNENQGQAITCSMPEGWDKKREISSTQLRFEITPTSSKAVIVFQQVYTELEGVTIAKIEYDGKIETLPIYRTSSVESIAFFGEEIGDYFGFTTLYWQVKNVPVGTRLFISQMPGEELEEEVCDMEMKKEAPLFGSTAFSLTVEKPDFSTTVLTHFVICDSNKAI